MNKEKVLEVKNLSVSFRTPNGLVRAVRDVTFDLYKGETLAIVGESGSGKSVTNRAIMGILARNAIIDGGEILYNNQDLTKLSEANFHKIRGNKIGMIFQDPLSSLNPTMRIGKQITEAMLVNVNRVRNKELDLYHTEYHDYLNLIEEIRILKQEIKDFAYEINVNDDLSKEEKKEQIKELKADRKARIADLKAEVPGLKKVYQDKKKEAEAIVKKEYDEIRASGQAKVKETQERVAKELEVIKAEYAKVLAETTERVTKELEALAAEQKDALDSKTAELQALKDKKAEYAEAHEFKAAFKAKKQELKALKKDQKDAYKAKQHEITAVKEDYKAQLKAKSNEVDDAKEELRRQFKVTKKEAFERAIEIMTEVGIPEAEKRFYQYPFQFSGGMRQRIVIATALTANPELLICDEPTTALDVTIQQQILNLIKEIKTERDLSVIFITHDLGVVANMASRVAVMYAGKIVEYGTSEEIFYNPQHPYTWALLSSVPDLDTTDRLISIPGTPPDMLFPPVGDAFADRNHYALKIDFLEQPPYFKVSDTHYAATWLLHPDAPKVEMPKVIRERVAKYNQRVGKKEVSK